MNRCTREYRLERAVRKHRSDAATRNASEQLSLSRHLANQQKVIYGHLENDRKTTERRRGGSAGLDGVVDDVLRSSPSRVASESATPTTYSGASGTAIPEELEVIKGDERAVSRPGVCLDNGDRPRSLLSESSPVGLGLPLELQFSPTFYRKYAVAVRTFPASGEKSSASKPSKTRRSVADHRKSLEVRIVEKDMERHRLRADGNRVPDWSINYGKPVLSTRKMNPVRP